MQISQDDILDALRTAMTPGVGPDEGFRTRAELVEVVGRGEEKVRRGLKALQKEGRLETKTVYRMALDGRMGAVPGYRVRPA